MRKGQGGEAPLAAAWLVVYHLVAGDPVHNAKRRGASQGYKWGVWGGDLSNCSLGPESFSLAHLLP